jgi:hypothetical protein
MDGGGILLSREHGEGDDEGDDQISSPLPRVAPELMTARSCKQEAHTVPPYQIPGVTNRGQAGMMTSNIPIPGQWLIGQAGTRND